MSLKLLNNSIPAYFLFYVIVNEVVFSNFILDLLYVCLHTFIYRCIWLRGPPASHLLLWMKFVYRQPCALISVLHIVYSFFNTTRSQVNICNRDCVAYKPEIFTMCLFNKKYSTSLYLEIHWEIYIYIHIYFTNMKDIFIGLSCNEQQVYIYYLWPFCKFILRLYKNWSFHISMFYLTSYSLAKFPVISHSF